MKDFAIGFAAVVALVVVMICAGLTAQYSVNDHQCRDLHDLMGVETHVSLSTGCLVKIDGRWMSGDSAVTNTREVTVK